MKKIVLPIVPIAIAVFVAVPFVTTPNSSNQSSEKNHYITSEIKPEPFVIGVIDSRQNTAIGTEITKALKKQDKAIIKLEKNIPALPEGIDAIWVSQENITTDTPTVIRLFKQAKQARKPFYLFGEHLDVHAISTLLDSTPIVEPELGNGQLTYSVDMVGYKFEQGITKPSYAISINRGNHLPDLEALKLLARRYNIDIRKQAQAADRQGFWWNDVAHAGGMTNISVPGNYSPIYTWETSVTNYVPRSATQTSIAKSYHIWKMYKDSTPSDPDYKDYIYIRADQPISSLERFRSEDVVNRLDADQTSNIITNAWEPSNSAWSATVSWNTDGDIEIFGATGSLPDDWHTFSVEDNEWTDTLLHPGDTWISTQSYSISQAATKHKIGHRFTHTVNGKSSYTEPSEYTNYHAKSTLDNFVFWVVAR